MVALSGARRKIWVGMIVGMMFALASIIALGGSNARAAFPTTEAPKQLSPAAKLSSELRQEFKNSSNGIVRYVAVLTEQANTDNDIIDWNAKGHYVLNALREVASRTQPGVSSFLNSQRIAGNVQTYKSYYIINAFQVTGNLASAEALANLPGIARIEAWPEITLDKPVAEAAQSPDAIEWNVAMVRAPQAWALDCNGAPCTGVGMVVGSLDTGARHTHQALVNQYRGNMGGGVFDHNYNWWDPVAAIPVPFDDPAASYHGTHTIGTAVGDDGQGNQIGVAPGAKWISTAGIRTGVTDPDVIEAGQWILAPWDLAGQNPDPSRRPHVASNSWGYGASGRNCSTQTFFRDIVQAWVAAGIFPSFSAGNAGTTGNRIPSAYPETFETGSITIAGLRSSFSSTGPSCFDQGQHPQVMAGGSAVRSAHGAADNLYQSLSGTSMAQPALAGAVAIIKQANPNLTIQQTWFILTSTAYMSPTWGTAPNVEYGWGLLQVDQAVLAARSLQGTPTPTVTGTPPTATRTATAPTATRTNTAATATATACTAGAVLTGSLDASDPDFTRPNTFQQGGTCTTNGVHNYDVYTLQTIGGQVTASTCGGASWDTYLIIYQAPGGIPIPGFVPSGCTNAIAANDDACGLQSTVTANLVAGTYYVVVSEFSTPGGAYTVTVTAPGACVTGTPSTTAVATSTRTGTSVVPSSTATSVNTVVATSTSTATRTNTAVASSTATTQPATATATRTPIPTATPCTIMFSDVPVNHTFYPFIRCLACRGIISGYADGTFKPGNEITRGQIAKMVSNAAGFSEDPGLQIYEDVNASNTFYVWINRLSRRGHMGGYACGTVPEEPCVLPQNRPYFRPYSNATRGQLAKIVSNAAGIQTTPSGVFYTDVQEDNPFYVWIMRLTERGVMSGYECGGVGEPCDPQNRPYFRPFNNVTRGQASKIVANTFYPGCEISSR